MVYDGPDQMVNMNSSNVQNAKQLKVCGLVDTLLSNIETATGEKSDSLRSMIISLQLVSNFNTIKTNTLS